MTRFIALAAVLVAASSASAQFDLVTGTGQIPPGTTGPYKVSVVTLYEGDAVFSSYVQKWTGYGEFYKPLSVAGGVFSGYAGPDQIIQPQPAIGLPIGTIGVWLDPKPIRVKIRIIDGNNRVVLGL